MKRIIIMLDIALEFSGIFSLVFIIPWFNNEFLIIHLPTTENISLRYLVVWKWFLFSFPRVGEQWWTVLGILIYCCGIFLLRLLQWSLTSKGEASPRENARISLFIFVLLLTRSWLNTFNNHVIDCHPRKIPLLYFFSLFPSFFLFFLFSFNFFFRFSFFSPFLKFLSISLIVFFPFSLPHLIYHRQYNHDIYPPPPLSTESGNPFALSTHPN